MNKDIILNRNMIINKDVITPKKLSSWLETNINENELIFDRCSNIFEVLVEKLKEHDLEVAVENRILMIKLCKFLYENSYK